MTKAPLFGSAVCVCPTNVKSSGDLVMAGVPISEIVEEPTSALEEPEGMQIGVPAMVMEPPGLRV